METETIIAIAGASLAFFALVFSISAHRRIGSARRSLALLQGSYEGRTLIDAVASYVDHVRQVEGRLAGVAKRQEELFALLGRSSRNLGLVRFDAFDEMGGKLSFSAALLDDHGEGVVITAINGRHEARLYAKPIEKGRSDHNLSPEEEGAISEALGSAQAVGRARR
jgi:hypothetical protein